MQRKLYKELWMMRFQKMLELEQRSIIDYGSILKECQNKRKGNSALETNLKKLISDEKKHAKLVEELLKITSRQDD